MRCHSLVLRLVGLLLLGSVVAGPAVAQTLAPPPAALLLRAAVLQEPEIEEPVGILDQGDEPAAVLGDAVADVAEIAGEELRNISDLIRGAAPDAGSFLRISHDENGEPVAMETAVARYVPAFGNGNLVVDLIGVVHFGERMYYQTLNQRFTQYDSLLYELVAPEGTRPDPRQRDRFNMILQKLAVLLVDLEPQLQLIDYSQPNFVHADLSPAGIGQAMRERGENRLTLILGVINDMLRQRNLRKYQMEQWTMNGYAHDAPAHEQVNWREDWRLYTLDPAGASRMKRLLATQLAGTDLGTGLGETIERILIQDRNAAVIDVLRDEVIDGKRHIGIFYGAGHMEDLEKRLLSEFGLRCESVEWLPAWNLQLRPRTPVEVVFKFMRN